MQSLVPGSLAAWIDRRAGGDPVVRLVLERQIDELRRALVSERAASLEALIVERVLVA